MTRTPAVLFGLVWLLFPGDASADFSAVIEQDGTVAYCLSNGSLLFADRCEGSGRLSIVQPVKDGAVVLKTATGTIKLENESPQNSVCAMSKARWNAAREDAIQTQTTIKAANRADLFRRLKTLWLKDLDALESDITTAFEADLDGDGYNEVVFIASNLERIADQFEKNKKSASFFVFAGIQDGTSLEPAKLFYVDQGEYGGGTDTLGDVKVKGLVSIAPATREIALLVKTSPALIGSQMIVRYGKGQMQKLDTIEFICN